MQYHEIRGYHWTFSVSAEVVVHHLWVVLCVALALYLPKVACNSEKSTMTSFGNDLWISLGGALIFSVQSWELMLPTPTKQTSKKVQQRNFLSHSIRDPWHRCKSPQHPQARQQKPNTNGLNSQKCNLCSVPQWKHINISKSNKTCSCVIALSKF